VAACCAGAAGRADQTDRRAAAVSTGYAGSGPRCGVRTGIAAIWLDRWPQCANRVSLGTQRFAQSGHGTGGIVPGRILVSSTPAVNALQQATRTIPVVFTQVADPVSTGIVASLAKPGGNVTGFMVFDYEIAAKWLELLKEIAPNVTRVGAIRDPTVTAGIGQLSAIQFAARLSSLEVIPLGGQDGKDIERTVTEFARGSNGGLVTVASPLTNNNARLIISLAARHRLPGTYPFRSFATEGGLISYGPDPIDAHRQAAGYVDRILKGEKPADLPVQAPTKFDLVINLKTAKALGLTVPPSLLSRANEVIELER